MIIQLLDDLFLNLYSNGLFCDTLKYEFVLIEMGDMMKKISLVGILFIGVLLVAGCTTAPQSELTGAVTVQPTGETKEITIDSYKWGFTQSPVNINKGDKVRVRVTSSSGIHGIAIPDFGVATSRISPGQEQVVEFVADKSGSFDYFCNVPCGSGHRSMRGQIVVD